MPSGNGENSDDERIDISSTLPDVLQEAIEEPAIARQDVKEAARKILDARKPKRGPRIAAKAGMEMMVSIIRSDLRRNDITREKARKRLVQFLGEEEADNLIEAILGSDSSDSDSFDSDSLEDMGRYKSKEGYAIGRLRHPGAKKMERLSLRKTYNLVESLEEAGAEEITIIEAGPGPEGISVPLAEMLRTFQGMKIKFILVELDFSIAQKLHAQIEDLGLDDIVQVLNADITQLNLDSSHGEINCLSSHHIPLALKLENDITTAARLKKTEEDNPDLKGKTRYIEIDEYAGYHAAKSSEEAIKNLEQLYAMLLAKLDRITVRATSAIARQHDLDPADLVEIHAHATPEEQKTIEALEAVSQDERDSKKTQLASIERIAGDIKAVVEGAQEDWWPSPLKWKWLSELFQSKGLSPLTKPGEWKISIEARITQLEEAGFEIIEVSPIRQDSNNGGIVCIECKLQDPDNPVEESASEWAIEGIPTFLPPPEEES